MKVLLLISVSAILTAISAPAAIVFDSITNGTFGGASTTITGPNSALIVFGTPSPFPNHEVAVEFQTGPLPSTLDQLEFALNTGLSPSTDAVDVSLSTGATAPGGAATVSLGSVSPTGSNPTEILSITPTVPPSLAANSSYWLHFTTSGNAPLYSLAPIFGGGATGSWSINEVSILHPNVSPNWTTQASLIPALRIQGTEAIPEPSAILLCTLGLLASMQRRR